MIRITNSQQLPKPLLKEGSGLMTLKKSATEKYSIKTTDKTAC